MADSMYSSKAREDFNKARTREIISGILKKLVRRETDLLSLDYAKEMLKPKSENYRGMQTVPISLIVGSEGRYKDFNSEFLPKHQHLRSRWERVDVAHYKQINLPPIKLYKIGGVYFVRDGNHRVSVARMQGVEFVDAEVIELTSEIELKPGMTREELKREVIKYEKEKFYRATGMEKYRDRCNLNFTAPGRYDDIVKHINEHRLFLEGRDHREVSFEEAMLSWCENVYKPVVEIIRKEKMLSRFPGRTEADLYVWILRHWNDLKKKWGEDYSMDDAARDLNRQFGKNLLENIISFFREIFGKGD